PDSGANYSTVYIGGDSSAFSPYGPYLGVSEKVDLGNADHRDNAFVFSDAIQTSSSDIGDYARELAGYVTHEMGHLLGYEHAHTVTADKDPLAEVAFKPYTHVEIAIDVRQDLLDDGKVMIGNQ